MLCSLLRLIKSDFAKLVLLLALAFYVAFVPHFDYPYPAHIDDWIHIAHSNALLRAGDINYPDPFSGQGAYEVVTHLELGYHLILAVFQKISGISWMDIARYFPSIVFGFTVLAVYVLARKLSFGWEAAFFTSLMPTTVGALGPGFLVPVAMGLMFVPLLFLLAFYYRTAWSYLLISLAVAFLVILHATSAVLTVVTLGPFVLLCLKDNSRHGLFVALALLLPFIVTLPWTGSLIAIQWNLLFMQKELPANHDFLKVVEGFGYMPILFCLLGTFVLTLRGKLKDYGLVLGLVVLLAMLATFYTLHYGIDPLYLRGLLFAMLMMGIVAGSGLMTLRKLEIPWLGRLKSGKPFVAQALGSLLFLMVIGTTLASTIPGRLAIPYYHMIDETDYEAFVWIRDNLPTDKQKAILDPWKASAFTGITGDYVYTWTHMTTSTQDNRAYDFLRQGSMDTAFLRKNGISIVYTRVDEGGRNVPYDSGNPDLVKLRDNVYLLNENP